MNKNYLFALLSAGVFSLLATTVSAQPEYATHIPTSEILTVFESMGESIDQMVRTVDIGEDTNAGVAVLQRSGVRSEGEAVNAIVHHDVHEVYYVISGSGMFMTGGEESNERELAADSATVLELIGPSGLRSIVNGKEHVIAAGDVVVIPAGVPHGFSHIQDQITYLAIRFDPDQKLTAGYVHPSLRN